MVGPPDTTPPTTTATLAGTLGSNGWYKAGEPVRLTLTATDAGSGVASTSYVVNGGAKQTYSGPVIFTDGVYTVTYYSTDKAGNVETTKAISFKVDQTPPSFSARGASPDQLWPLNHQMVDVTTPVAVADGGSGLAGFVLKSATSSEPDNGLGDGDTPNDIQGFEVGKPDTQGQLRAERSGRGSGRIYTLTYEGLDTAGNAQTCTAAATVPHDQGPITPGKPVRPLASPTVLPLVSPTIPAPRQQSLLVPRQSDSAPAGPSLRLVAVGPEQGGQGLAAVGSIGDGEVDQQGERPAQIRLDRPAVALGAGRGRAASGAPPAASFLPVGAKRSARRTPAQVRLPARGLARL